MLLLKTPIVETPRLTTRPLIMRLTYRHGVCPPPFVTENTAPVASSSVPFLHRNRSPGCGVTFGSRRTLFSHQVSVDRAWPKIFGDLAFQRPVWRPFRSVTQACLKTILFGHAGSIIRQAAPVSGGSSRASTPRAGPSVPGHGAATASDSRTS